MEHQNRMLEQQQQMMFTSMFEKMVQSKVDQPVVQPPSKPEAPWVGSALDGGSVVKGLLDVAAAAVARQSSKPTSEQMCCISAAAATLRKHYNSLLNTEQRLQSLKERQELSTGEMCAPGIKPYLRRTKTVPG